MHNNKQNVDRKFAVNVLSISFFLHRQLFSHDLLVITSKNKYVFTDHVNNVQRLFPLPRKFSFVLYSIFLILEKYLNYNRTSGILLRFSHLMFLCSAKSNRFFQLLNFMYFCFCHKANPLHPCLLMIFECLKGCFRPH